MERKKETVIRMERAGGAMRENGRLTPSPSITSTSFGCVVPFLDKGIVRPSKCVMVRSNPSKA